ncbi:hypothetical protein HELRODRAFT_161204 [Helobdella robusta]|uniref:Uncharacterized protein n=1 Tax=Helobdella robusta TaxID=6412 RepID=T1ER74_HELRO|nr:hypothetical protein HELRODRAFT_161204 [Helobdella robusta]ESO01987.1 hypothetical protein HELRODRAFT_161204 [Helobdella robusta]
MRVLGVTLTRLTDCLYSKVVQPYLAVQSYKCTASIVQHNYIPYKWQTSPADTQSSKQFIPKKRYKYIQPRGPHRNKRLSTCIICNNDVVLKPLHPLPTSNRMIVAIALMYANTKPGRAVPKSEKKERIVFVWTGWTRVSSPPGTHQQPECLSESYRSFSLFSPHESLR